MLNWLAIVIIIIIVLFMISNFNLTADRRPLYIWEVQTTKQ